MYAPEIDEAIEERLDTLYKRYSKLSHIYLWSWKSYWYQGYRRGMQSYIDIVQGEIKALRYIQKFI